MTPAPAGEAGGHLLVQRQGPVAVLTLNRPEKRNALTRELLGDLCAEIVRQGADGDVAAMVLTGAGTAFCAGVDLDDARRETTDTTPYLEYLYRVGRALRALSQPVIAAMNGHAVGNGLALAMMSDVRIVAEDARLTEGYINVGVFPGGGDAYLLPNLVGPGHALRMIWTGEPILGRQGVAIGLAEEALPAAEVLPAAIDLATRVAAKPRHVVAMVKRAVYEMQGLDFEGGLEASAEFSARTSELSGRPRP